MAYPSRYVPEIREPESDCNHAADWRPGRLWSLWEVMINYKLDRVCGAIRSIDTLETELRVAQTVGYAAGSESPAFNQIGEQIRQRVADILLLIDGEAADLDFNATKHRLSLLKLRLPKITSRSILSNELIVLRETLEGDLKTRFFYAYPADKAKAVENFDGDWASINSQFKSAAQDARSGVDCYALGHPTAAVFHMMRVGEYGLRALARECGVKLPRKQVLEWADWQTIISGIKAKADAIANKRRGPKREAALEFYRGALASFEGFKDEFRNNVSHARKSYIDADATRAREHVFHFMNRLADKTDEKGKRIKWGIR